MKVINTFENPDLTFTPVATTITSVGLELDLDTQETLENNLN